MPNVNEYGLLQLIDLGLLNPNQNARVADSGLLAAGILYDNAQHNADINALLGTFAVTTTEYTEEIQSQGSARNQPLDENGRSIPIKPLAPYTVAYPIQGSGNAWGANFVTRAQLTVRELARTLARMYRGDYAWVRDHVLGALFASSSYSFRDPTGKGTLTIRGLANSDSTTYFSNATGGEATDTHYLAQAAAIADASNPYPTIYAEIKEHPDNDGEVVAFISTSLVATTQALAEFNSATIDADITLGANTDRLTGTLGIVLPPFASLKGKTDSGVWIVEMPDLPAGYIVAITTQGEKPLARRQFATPELQGFRPAEERNNFPFWEEQWHRWEGYAARNRVGAVAYRIGNASWAVPTNFDMPMR
jgi:hypothetical protein